MSYNLRIDLRGRREIKGRNEVSDSGDACGLYLAEAGLPRGAITPPLEIVAVPGPRHKIESPINDECVNRWGKETNTNRCRASLPAP